MNGGYQLIDCTGLNILSESEQTINGLYAKLRKYMDSNKPLYCVNATWGTAGKISPIQVFAIQLDTDLITCTASTLQIWVTNADKVTVHNMIQS